MQVLSEPLVGFCSWSSTPTVSDTAGHFAALSGAFCSSLGFFPWEVLPVGACSLLRAFHSSLCFFLLSGGSSSRSGVAVCQAAQFLQSPVIFPVFSDPDARPVVEFLGSSAIPLLPPVAGVGRTGTYVALDYLLGQAAAEGVVDAFECVSEMRTRRPCMIQTVEQYELLHDALYESLSTAKFSCQPTDVEARMAKHVQQPRSDVDLISAEFQHARERTGSVEHSFLPGKDPANHHKNRFHEILPSESSMPFLTNGANGNYINAVFVDGYRDKKEWIATQLPLAKTLADFWQLMIEKDIPIIIQLESSPTSMQVRVIIVNEQSSESLPTADAILSLQETTSRVQQELMCKRMCATCLDGSTKSRLFICAHNAIEQLKTEQMVDVYTPTVMAQLRRPQFISTIDQYELLYKVLIDYLHAFGEYSNFR
ncbi:receptor-type tyrosine-protein phosphatase epsilon-like [Watersipora subatra]|uniref:receptor-type tyrosine-protein phosphatase epsilon-like n=1 Tax=Watersipora subatra TaxID=2589382 RepID=UPI00355AE37A